MKKLEIDFYKPKEDARFMLYFVIRMPIRQLERDLALLSSYRWGIYEKY